MILPPYQLDDLARLALLDGAILSWDCGLGKTLAMFCWAFLKCGWTGRLKIKAPVLIVSPEERRLLAGLLMVWQPATATVVAFERVHLAHLEKAVR